jgi:lipopolysaccharide transport system permease protein
MEPSSHPSPRSETVIRPTGGWRSLELGELLGAWELLAILTWRDVKVRYKQTVLGAAWALLQPVAMTVVFSFALQRWARLPPGDLPFALYLYTGMWVWVFFSTALTTSANSVISAERVITKVYFPRLTIPIAAVLASVIDFVIATAGFFVLAVIYDIPPSWTWLMTPVIIGLVALLAVGMGAGLSALMVVFRDVRYVLPFLVQLLLFATPSIYLATSAGGVEDAPVDPVSVTAVSQDVGDGVAGTEAKPAEPAATEQPAQDAGRAPRRPGTGLLALHPLDGLVASFRAAALGGAIPWGRLGMAALMTLIVFAGGCLIFRRLEDTFADVI